MLEGFNFPGTLADGDGCVLLQIFGSTTEDTSARGWTRAQAWYLTKLLSAQEEVGEDVPVMLCICFNILT